MHTEKTLRAYLHGGLFVSLSRFMIALQLFLLYSSIRIYNRIHQECGDAKGLARYPARNQQRLPGAKSSPSLGKMSKRTIPFSALQAVVLFFPFVSKKEGNMSTAAYERIVLALRASVKAAKQCRNRGAPAPIVLFEGNGPVGPASKAPSEQLMYLAACEGISIPNTLAKTVRSVFGPDLAVRYESESRGDGTNHWRFVLIKR